MKVSEFEYEDLTQEIVDKMLFEGIEDINIDGDCIMILGSNKANQYRIPKAMEVYKARHSKKILLSGGIIRETENGPMSETDMMKNKLLEFGIPVDNILFENTSLNTKENMICSLLTLERAFGLNNIHRILLVTTRYHMRRSLLMAEAYMPKWIEISPCPADDKSTLRHNWFLNETGSKRARDEAYKISCYIREGSIADFEI